MIMQRLYLQREIQIRSLRSFGLINFVGFVQASTPDMLVRKHTDLPPLDRWERRQYPRGRVIHQVLSGSRVFDSSE